MLAPLCGDGGQTITWSWSAAPDATAYQLQISTSGAQLPDGTLRQADVLNARLDAVTTGYTMAATPGQPYYAVVLPVTPGAGADATRTSRLTEAVCVNPGSGSRPLPPAPSPTAVDNSATPVAAAAPAAPPDAPTNLTATPLDGSEVRLDWVSNSTDEHGFAIDDGYGAVAQVPAGVTTITLVGLDPDGPYCAAVYAFNQAGASALSNFVCFTTLQASDDGGVGSLRITAASRHGGRSGRG
ncbi:MAG TPA: fibronectin type III domain-containing protein [Dehalococcoidia bacterium]|nr:fibronectin type III domain-containing protein [Dehalococcoidia bacterium]